MPGSAPRRRTHQVPSFVLVALRAAGAVDNDLCSRHRRIDSLAGCEVACHILDALRDLWAMPAEHSDFAAGVAKSRDDKSPQGACASGDQSLHGCLLVPPS